MKLGHRELGRAIKGHEKVYLAFAGPHLGDVHVEEADRVDLELRFLWRVSLQIRQTRDVVALKTAMQGRARETRD